MVDLLKCTFCIRLGRDFKPCLFDFITIIILYSVFLTPMMAGPARLTGDDDTIMTSCKPDSCTVDQYCLDHGGIAGCYSCPDICPGYPSEAINNGQEITTVQYEPRPTPSFACIEKCSGYLKLFEMPTEPPEDDIEPGYSFEHNQSSGFLGQSMVVDCLVVVLPWLCLLGLVIFVGSMFRKLKHIASYKQTPEQTKDDSTADQDEKTEERKLKDEEDENIELKERKEEHRQNGGYQLLKLEDETKLGRDQNGHVPNGGPHMGNVVQNGGPPTGNVAQNGGPYTGNVAQNGGLYTGNPMQNGGIKSPRQRHRSVEDENEYNEKHQPHLEGYFNHSASIKTDSQKCPVLVTQPTNSS